MIAFILGFLIVFGAVGGIENDQSLIESTILAFIGLSLMYVGTSKYQ